MPIRRNVFPRETTLVANEVSDEGQILVFHCPDKKTGTQSYMKILVNNPYLSNAHLFLADEENFFQIGTRNGVPLIFEATSDEAGHITSKVYSQPCEQKQPSKRKEPAIAG